MGKKTAAGEKRTTTKATGVTKSATKKVVLPEKALERAAARKRPAASAQKVLERLLKRPAAAAAAATKKPSSSGKASLRVYGDSNAVGYRPPPRGTKGCFFEYAQRHFSVLPTVGKTRLTILPSDFQFLPWAQAKLSDEQPGLLSDHSLLVLGTNDITYLRKRIMEWSAEVKEAEIARLVRTHLHQVLQWIRGRTLGTIFVVEPLNEMQSKADMKALVVSAVREEVSSKAYKGKVCWLPMAWSAEDLQVLEKGPDPRHFNRRAVHAILDAAVARKPRAASGARPGVS
eukprot:CAMPEP_0177195036 /NCGR_PEP_ID=MMETSP0367-20130122/23293_1 /TAXON_ID=447022 ORGANISM="Scrippsiella hangoei-like, Strain SHHI-4" /NCGR_SAMPLE_ID=MMETSP0367 /ASSEMBLY_ACC=CAM_ASM_000362 /LENGTH=286 /DNA_ID=CAMNT_0018643025 /DNA_START=63 /DNA_END=920 /DNA_ORIENTATION=+